jgi:hypothetical protein
MYARVARFEDVDQTAMDAVIEAIRQESSSGPPEGVPATEFFLLADRNGGKMAALTLFETEEDLRKGDEALNAMNPPTTEGMGRRTAVEMWEVPLHMET